MATLIEFISLMFCFCLWLSTALDGAASSWMSQNKRGQWEEQIVNGVYAIAGEFPFMARVARYYSPDWRVETSCGGSIIDEWHILTALHCIVNGPNLYKENFMEGLKLYNPDYLSVHLGCHHKKECDQAVNISRVMAHFALGRDLANDIALLKTKTKIKFNNKIGLGAVRPAKIASRTEKCCDEKPVNTTAIGWGELKQGFLITVFLKKVELETQTYEQCKENYPHINRGVLCAGGITKSPCFGDSGGPLLRKLDDGSLLQVGIFSFIESQECVDKKGAGFTKIAHYRDWMDDCIAGNDCEVLNTDELYPFN